MVAIRFRRSTRSALAAVLLLLFWCACALAEPVRVSAKADPDAAPSAARQQALERAFAEAALQGAQSLLPVPLPASRAAALRDFLAPRAVDYIQSYQETPAAKAADQQPAGPYELSIDAEVNRTYLRSVLVELGLFSGARHPRVFSVKLGAGVKEQDLKALDGLNVIMGLSRAAQAPTEVTLERLPQGYFKAVLRHGAANAAAGGGLAADAKTLPELWLSVWGRYFAGLEQQGGSLRSLTVRGFASVDGVQEFARVLAGWDDAVQMAVLSRMELKDGGVSARFSLRVVSQPRLEVRLGEYLPGRRLTSVMDEQRAEQ